MLHFDRKPEAGGVREHTPGVPGPGWKPEVAQKWRAHCDALTRLCHEPVVQERIKHFAGLMRACANPPVAEGRLIPDCEASFKDFHRKVEVGLSRRERDVGWWAGLKLSSKDQGTCTFDEIRGAIMQKAVVMVLRDLCLDKLDQGSLDVEGSQRQVDLVLSLFAGSTGQPKYDIKLLAVVGAFADFVSDSEFLTYTPLNRAVKGLCSTFFEKPSDTWRDKEPLLEIFRQYLFYPRLHFNQGKIRGYAQDYQEKKIRYGLLGLDIWEQIERSRMAAHVDARKIGSTLHPDSFAAVSAKFTSTQEPSEDVYLFRKGR